MKPTLASTMLPALLVIVCTAYGALAREGQVSAGDAEARLRAKLATRPATTQPTEADKLRKENRRLRLEVVRLEEAVATLKKKMLARAGKSTTNPSTRPADVSESNRLLKILVGHWRGGDSTAGTSYLIEFKTEGVYKQSFVAQNVKETGQFRVTDENTIEMWSDTSPETRKHNLYDISATDSEVILTPIAPDGQEVKVPKSVILRRVQ